MAAFVICTLAATPAFAKPSLYAYVYLEGAVVAEKGAIVLPPLTIDLELGISIPLKGRVSWYVGLSAALPSSAFTPAPRVITGPSFTLIEDKLYVSPVALYQFDPPYGESSTSHTVGGGVNLFGAITKYLCLGIVLGGGATLGDGIPTSGAFVVAPNVGATLW